MRITLSPFFRFLLTGGTSAIVTIVSRLGLSEIMPFEAAVILSYIPGMTVAYILAKLFVFAPSRRSVQSEYLRFAIVNVMSLVQVWIVSVGLARWIFPSLDYTFHAELVAHIAGLLSTAFTSYHWHKLFTFGAAHGK